MSHLSEQIQRFHAGHRVGSDAQHHSGRHEPLHRGRSVAVAQVGPGADGHGAAPLRQQPGVGGIGLHRMDRQHVAAQDSQLVQQRHRGTRRLERRDVPPAPCLGERAPSPGHQLGFRVGFGDVHRDGQSLAAGERRHLPVEGPAHGIWRVG